MLETRSSYHSTATCKRSTLNSHASALPSAAFAQQRHTLSDASMYDASKGTPPPTQHSSSSTFPECEGWIYKQSDRYKTWNRRWFVLHGTNLFYFKNPKVSGRRGFVVCPQCNSCISTPGFENERYHSFARLSRCSARCQQPFSIYQKIPLQITSWPGENLFSVRRHDAWYEALGSGFDEIDDTAWFMR